MRYLTCSPIRFKVAAFCLSAWLCLLPLHAQVNIVDLAKYISRAQKDWNVPGLAVGIVKDGEVLMSRGFGTLKAGTDSPVDGGSLFAIASNTKAFIATALAMLVEDGKLSWDDRVVDHLPYFELYDAYATQHATVRDLLCHRLGLGTYSGDVIWYRSNYAPEEVIRRIKHVPQAYDFRGGYGYSNLMFITAGEVIKAVSGQDWDVFVRRRILDPLEMSRTQTSVASLADMDNVAQPHKPTGTKNTPIPYVNWDNMGAAGGIISSTDDMLKWIQLQLEGGVAGDDTLFTRESQITLWTPHNNYRVSEQRRDLYPGHHFAGYGLGWGLMDYGGKLVVQHGGGYDGMYSRVAMVPEERLGVVVLTNSMKGISPAITHYILDRFLGHEEKDWSTWGKERQEEAHERHAQRIKRRSDARVTGTQPSLPLSAFAGTYRCKMYGELRVYEEDGGLHLDFLSAPDLSASLTHWHYNTFELAWKQAQAWFDFGTLQFVLDNNGTPQELKFDVPNNDIFFYEIQAMRVD